MNKVILMGRLTKDPNITYKDTTTIAKYTLAVDSWVKGEKSTDFINCVVFGKGAEFAEKHLHKGSKILIEGHWQTGSYQRNDGSTAYTNNCFIERQEFAESKAASSAQSAPSQNNDDDFMNGEVPTEELPFR